ncbi:MAG: D-2-hydroxyacid dehydrogenase [Caldibacillus sp.]
MYIIIAAGLNEKMKKRLCQTFVDVEFAFYNSLQDVGDDLTKAEVLVTYGQNLTEERLRKAENLQWLMVLSAGLDHLPLKAIKERGILLTNVRGIHKIPISEFVFAFILQYVKKFPLFLKEKERKHWNRQVQIDELYGKTLLVVGAGAIGSHIAKLAKGFGMKTLGIKRSVSKNEHFDAIYPMEKLDEVLPLADFVVSVLPSTEATKNVFTKEQFSLMKTNSVFINVGRGDAVNERDLLAALNQGEIAHAYLDVFQEEPLPENHPFWSCKNITITPHITGVTAPYLERAMEIFETNLHHYLNEKEHMINIVDLDRGY